MGKLKLKSHPLNGTCTTNGLLKRFVCQPIAMFKPFSLLQIIAHLVKGRPLMSYKCLLFFAQSKIQ